MAKKGYKLKFSISIPFFAICVLLYLTNVSDADFKDEPTQDVLCVPRIFKKKVVCFYEVDEAFRPDEVDPCLCSHIIYSFVVLRDNLAFIAGKKGDLKLLTGLRRRNPDLRVLVSLRPTQFIFGNVERVTSGIVSKSHFIERVRDFVAHHDLDGIDLDWQYFQKLDNGNYNLLPQLVSELRRAFDDYDPQVRREDTLITVTSDNLRHLSYPFNIGSLEKDVDFINLPTFAILNSGKNQNRSEHFGISDAASLDSVVDVALASGISKEKLVIGIAGHGRVYQSSVGSNLTNSSRPPSFHYWEQKEDIPFYEVCLLRDRDNFGYTLVREKDLTSPYVYLNHEFIRFDDEVSLKLKSRYVQLRGLGGLALFAMNDDDRFDKCHSGFNPLQRAIASILARPVEHNDLLNEQTSLSFAFEKYGNVGITESDNIEEIQRAKCSEKLYRRNSKDCTQFHRCDETTPNQALICPEGQIFDDHYETCNWPSWSPSCPGSGEISEIPNQKFVCTSYGYFQSPRGCEYFIYCSDFGKDYFTGYEFQCPFDLAFDEEKLLCNWKWLVPGCDKNKASSVSDKHKASQSMMNKKQNDVSSDPRFLGPEVDEFAARSDEGMGLPAEHRNEKPSRRGLQRMISDFYTSVSEKVQEVVDHYKGIQSRSDTDETGLRSWFSALNPFGASKPLPVSRRAARPANQRKKRQHFVSLPYLESKSPQPQRRHQRQPSIPLQRIPHQRSPPPKQQQQQQPQVMSKPVQRVKSAPYVSFEKATPLETVPVPILTYNTAANHRPVKESQRKPTTQMQSNIFDNIEASKLTTLDSSDTFIFMDPFEMSHPSLMQPHVEKYHLQQHEVQRFPLHQPIMPPSLIDLKDLRHAKPVHHIPQTQNLKHKHPSPQRQQESQRMHAIEFGMPWLKQQTQPPVRQQKLHQQVHHHLNQQRQRQQQQQQQQQQRKPQHNNPLSAIDLMEMDLKSLNVEPLLLRDQLLSAPFSLGSALMDGTANLFNNLNGTRGKHGHSKKQGNKKVTLDVQETKAHFHSGLHPPIMRTIGAPTYYNWNSYHESQESKLKYPNHYNHYSSLPPKRRTPFPTSRPISTLATSHSGHHGSSSPKAVTTRTGFKAVRPTSAPLAQRPTLSKSIVKEIAKEVGKKKSTQLLIVPVPDNHPQAQSLEEIQKMVKLYPNLFPKNLDFSKLTTVVKADPGESTTPLSVQSSSTSATNSSNYVLVVVDEEREENSTKSGIQETVSKVTGSKESKYFTISAKLPSTSTTEATSESPESSAPEPKQKGLSTELPKAESPRTTKTTTEAPSTPKLEPSSTPSAEVVQSPESIKPGNTFPQVLSQSLYESIQKVITQHLQEATKANEDIFKKLNQSAEMESTESSTHQTTAATPFTSSTQNANPMEQFAYYKSPFWDAVRYSAATAAEEAAKPVEGPVYKPDSAQETTGDKEIPSASNEYGHYEHRQFGNTKNAHVVYAQRRNSGETSNEMDSYSTPSYVRGSSRKTTHRISEIKPVSVKSITSKPINHDLRTREQVTQTKFQSLQTWYNIHSGIKNLTEGFIPESACTRPGLFQHPTDCNRFYECYWDRYVNKFTLHLFDCPVKLGFDARIVGCNAPGDSSVCVQY